MLILEAAMWTPEDRALVGDFGSGQARSDDRYCLIEPFIPPPKRGGRPGTTDMRLMLEDEPFAMADLEAAYDHAVQVFGDRA